MFSSNQQKMRMYRKNIKLEAVNDFKQGQALDEYLLHEQGIESQERGMSKFAEAIGQAVSEGLRENKPIDKVKQWAYQKSSSPALDDNIVSKSNKAPKSIAQPKGPKKLFSINNDRENVLMGNEDRSQIGKFVHLKNGVINELGDAIKRSKQIKENRSMGGEDKPPVYSKDLTDTKAKLKKQEPDMMKFGKWFDHMDHLNVKDDHEIRVKFMTVLNDMKNKVETTNKEKALANDIMKAMERMRFADTLRELENDPQKKAYAEKAIENLHQLTDNKKTNNKVKSGAAKRKAAANKERLLELEKAQRKKNDTNAELNTFQDLLFNFDSSVGAHRRTINSKLRHIVDRQEKLNPAIAQRMRTMADSLKRR